MIVLPAIDLRNGKCVRLYKGDFAQEETSFLERTCDARSEGLPQHSGHERGQEVCDADVGQGEEGDAKPQPFMYTWTFRALS